MTWDNGIIGHTPVVVYKMDVGMTDTAVFDFYLYIMAATGRRSISVGRTRAFALKQNRLWLYSYKDKYSINAEFAYVQIPQFMNDCKKLWWIEVHT